MSEESSSSLLMSLGNILGIVILYSTQALIDTHPQYTVLWSPASIFLMVVLSAAALLIVFGYHGPRLRHDHELVSQMKQEPSSAVSSSNMILVQEADI